MRVVLLFLSLSARAMASGMPQFNLSTYPTQVFWLVVSFACLFFIMWKLALPRVDRMLSHRKQVTLLDLRKAEEFCREAELSEQECHKIIAEAKEKAHSIFQKAQEENAATLETTLRATDERMMATFASVRERLQREKEEAWAQLQASVPSLVQDAAEKFIDVPNA